MMPSWHTLSYVAMSALELLYVAALVVFVVGLVRKVRVR